MNFLSLNLNNANDEELVIGGVENLEFIGDDYRLNSKVFTLQILSSKAVYFLNLLNVLFCQVVYIPK